MIPKIGRVSDVLRRIGTPTGRVFSPGYNLMAIGTAIGGTVTSIAGIASGFDRLMKTSRLVSYPLFFGGVAAATAAGMAVGNVPPPLEGVVPITRTLMDIDRATSSSMLAPAGMPNRHNNLGATGDLVLAMHRNKGRIY